nr:hypothetical protein [Tanacetum cinerariifolium]
MTALRYKDEHNKVGYLLKPTGSDDYHQIIDFLSASHIRAPEFGPPAILAMIDKTSYTITEDLVRSRLQLADDGELSILRGRKSVPGMNSRERGNGKKKTTPSSRELHDKELEHMAWQTDYCIMEKEMSILRGRKSVPGMNSSERGKWK